jgi:hypothetical protein
MSTSLVLVCDETEQAIHMADISGSGFHIEWKMAG